MTELMLPYVARHTRSRNTVSDTTIGNSSSLGLSASWEGSSLQTYHIHHILNVQSTFIHMINCIIWLNQNLNARYLHHMVSTRIYNIHPCSSTGNAFDFESFGTLITAQNDISKLCLFSIHFRPVSFMVVCLLHHFSVTSLDKQKKQNWDNMHIECSKYLQVWSL